MTTFSSPIAQARAAAREGIRWLDLIRYVPVAGMWTVGPRHCLYHAILAPEASDEVCLHACDELAKHLDRHIAVEVVEAERQALTATAPREDPYDAAWCTTLRGAALETARRHLIDAAQGLRSAGIVPNSPSREDYDRVYT